jgi:hypothetical protein
MMEYWGKRWTIAHFRVGNGSKQFGMSVWWNSDRAGLEIHFWLWGYQIMRERKS